MKYIIFGLLLIANTALACDDAMQETFDSISVANSQKAIANAIRDNNYQAVVDNALAGDR